MNILILVIFNFILYYKTIDFGLIVDDEFWYDKIRDSGFMKLREVNSINKLLHVISQHSYSGTTFGTNTRIEHGFTIFLHTTASCLIYIAFGRNEVSFIASLLYSCNPINHQTSIWLNGRRYLINVILALSIMIVYPYGILGKIIALSLYFFTGLLHLTAVFVPVLFGIDKLLLLAGIYLLYGDHIKGVITSRSSLIAESGMKHFTPKRLIIVVKSYGFYFWRALIPGICALNYPDLYYWEKTKEGNKNAYSYNLDFYKGLSGILFSIGVIFILPRDLRPMVLFSILAILQWCNIISVLQTLADRYVSVAVPFLMFFLSYLLSFTGIFYIPIVILIATYYCVALYVVLPMYLNIISFYEYQIKYFPSIPTPRTAYIESLMVQGNARGAEGLVRSGLLANTQDFELLRLGALFSLFNQNKKNGLVFCDEADKNYYIGQEEDQNKEINNLRELLNKING